MNRPTPNPIDATALKPRCLPGRRTRKARAFEAEIARLRAEGYTFEAIRDALAVAGVQVGLTTVKREAARRRTVPQAPEVTALPSRPACPDASPPEPRPDAPSPAPAASPSSPDLRSGKEIAADFMRTRITNPLFHNRS
jgi:hypothetical protein